MVVFPFSILNKDDKERFLEESFLLADVKPDIVLGMLFLTMSNTDVDFQARDLQLSSYTNGDVLLTNRWVELIRKKDFTIPAFNLGHEAFVVHIATVNVNLDDEVYPSRRAQIAHLKADEAPSKVSSEYADFADIFSLKLAADLLEHTGIKYYTIELVVDWQPPYNLI